MESSSSTHKKGLSFGKIILIIILLGMIGGLAGLGYLYYQTREELKFLASPAGQDELARREVENVVSALGKLAILPQEEPVIATITDKDALASQSAFYRNAENGDKLVVFAEAQQAYIFSPGRNKIVNVGPLLIEEAPVGENAGGVTEQVGAVSTATVEIRNGSTVPGRGTQLSNQISSGFEGVEILGVGEAVTTEYEGLQIIDLSNGEHAAVAEALASQLGGQVVNVLPSGEVNSSADILLIAGNQ